ncbi:protein RALF-like 19 [Carica papaya]|uniref:protein RALF-like 19 n=1 Tax=Carica papaya TaxID=3649 RepID=UPI000B8C9C2C|nr:protein RALF-like 19 [Carica papaya]
MDLKLLFIFALLFMAIMAESVNANWALGKSCANGDCLIDDDDEGLMESEISRRTLAQNRRYISYGALKANNIPCKRRGASYYNCRKRNRVNPYKRGCSVITRCYRFTS